jgi:hypothetical protein
MKSFYLTSFLILSAFGCSTSLQTDLRLCEHESQLLSTEAPVVEFTNNFDFNNEMVSLTSYSGGKPFNGQFNLNNNPIIVQTLIEGIKQTDNHIHPPRRIFLSVNNESFLFNYSKLVSNEEFAKSLKKHTNDFYLSSGYRMVIYDIDWIEGTNEKRKIMVLTAIIRSYLDLLNDLSNERYSKSTCDLIWSEMHDLRNDCGFAFWVSNNETAVFEKIPELEIN